MVSVQSGRYFKRVVLQQKHCMHEWNVNNWSPLLLPGLCSKPALNWSPYSNKFLVSLYRCVYVCGGGIQGGWGGWGEACVHVRMHVYMCVGVWMCLYVFVRFLNQLLASVFLPCAVYVMKFLKWFVFFFICFSFLFSGFDILYSFCF